MEQNYFSNVKIATEKCDDGKISLRDWQRIVLQTDDLGYSDEYIRRAFVFFKCFFDNIKDSYYKVSDEDKQKELEILLDQIKKEKKKIQTLNIEYNANERADARAELFLEQVLDAIDVLDPIEIKKIEYKPKSHKTALLVVSDQHYGSNFEIKGLFGEIVNSYSEQIFQDRMWNLLGKITSDDFKFDKLKIVSCGDCLEGILRMSSLSKLKQPVVKCAIEFAEFMSEWLNEVSKRLNVPIEFAMVGGNHGVLRMLGQKPEFKEENIEYVIHEFIRLRLLGHKNIQIEPYEDVYFTTIYNSNKIFSHGENKDLEQLLNYFENLYDITIDECYGGHYHHSSSKDVGVANTGSRKNIRVPSICGTDAFAVKLNKHNRAGAYFALFDEDGEVFNKIYYLN